MRRKGVGRPECPVLNGPSTDSICQVETCCPSRTLGVSEPDEWQAGTHGTARAADPPDLLTHMPRRLPWVHLVATCPGRRGPWPSLVTQEPPLRKGHRCRPVSGVGWGGASELTWGFSLLPELRSLRPPCPRTPRCRPGTSTRVPPARHLTTGPQAARVPGLCHSAAVTPGTSHVVSAGFRFPVANPGAGRRKVPSAGAAPPTRVPPWSPHTRTLSSP